MLKLSLNVPALLWSVVSTQFVPEMFHSVPRQLVGPLTTVVTSAVMLALGATVTVAPPFSVADCTVSAACATAVIANARQKHRIDARHLMDALSASVGTIAENQTVKIAAA